MKRTIAVLYGGIGVEHEVSLSGYSYVKELLESLGHETIPIYINKSGEWSLTKGDATEAVFASPNHGGSIFDNRGNYLKLDAAIPLLHGDGGESGEIQGLLKTAGIPFVGASTVTGAICIDKHYTKCVAQNLGIPVANWVAFSEKTDTDTALSICEEKIGFPMFLKPRRLGSSVGAYPVWDKNEFHERFPQSMAAGNDLVMAEELFGEKRELECAFYEARGVRRISNPGEILTRGFYGYDEKYNKNTVITPRAQISDSVAKEIQKYNDLLSNALSLRHLARIDYFLTEKGVIFNEINTFPGFTPHSLYPKLLTEMGIAPKDAIAAFIEDAINAGLV